MSRSPLKAGDDPDQAYLDLFGQLSDRIRKGSSFSGRERNCAFINQGGVFFADASATVGLDLEQDSRGLAVTDWDHDGDVDLWMTNRTAPRLQLMQNQGAAGSRRSLAFLLVGDPALRCPRDAAGARVVVTIAGGDRVKTVHLGDGFLSQSSRWLHFGIGGIRKIDRVVDAVHPFVTDSIWLGKINRLRNILPQNCPNDVEAIARGEKLMAMQNDDAIRALYHRYSDDPKIKWKDRIKKVIGLERPTALGLDE